MTFSKNLALLRREKKVSQKEAAAALGVSQALLSHYENSLREPGLGFITCAAAYYGCSTDYLLGVKSERGTAPLPHADCTAELAELRSLCERALARIGEIEGKTHGRK